MASSGERLVSQSSVGDGNNLVSEENYEDQNVTLGAEHDNNKGEEIVRDRILFNLCKEDIMALEFNSESDAQSFYRRYALVKGFSVRLADVGWNKKHEMIWRKYVCNCQGLRDKKYTEDIERKREHRAVTRCDCKAMLQVKLNKLAKKWYVHQFVEEHTHELTSHKHAQFLRSHRMISEPDKALINSMVSLGIKPCHIMGYVAGYSGGYENAGFHSKDMYNYICRVRKDMTMGGDAMAAINYLRGMADNDPLFFMRHKVNDEGRLKHLFWADGVSRVNFEYFGDVLAFDTTYKINKYNLPFVIFSGVNHHRQTVVFGCALIANEKEETYKWVLEVFVEAMNNKKPVSVVTDSDKAMRKAIKHVFPGSTHRICAWHLQRNAQSNIGNVNFTAKFKHCMFGDFGVEEFECEWRIMVDKFGLDGNRWVQKIYRKKGRWASAYLRGKFFAGLRTTSRCEGMNSLIKNFIERSSSLVEFLHHFQRALNHSRYNEVKANYKSLHTEPMLTTALRSIEKSGAAAYTREAFWIFCEQVIAAGACYVSERDQRTTNRIYFVKVYCKPELTSEVWFYKSANKFKCSCGKMESFGFPCKHIICVMVQENIQELPDTCILKRWTKKAKCLTQTIPTDAESDQSYKLHFGALIQSCRMMCNLAARSVDDFTATQDKICSIMNLLEAGQHTSKERNSEIFGKDGRVLDPTIVHTKGWPVKVQNPAKSVKVQNPAKRVKCCPNCRREGHTRKRCPLEMQPEDMSNGVQCSTSVAVDEAAKGLQDSVMEGLKDEAGGGPSNHEGQWWTLDERNQQQDDILVEHLSQFRQEADMSWPEIW